MTTTPGNLVAQVLFESGVIGRGQTASGTDIWLTFTRLNQMMSQWNRKRWLVYALENVGFVSTGAQSYTVGTGQNFNVARPDQLENSCFMRQLNTSGGEPIDYPMDLLLSYEAYNRIRLKSMGTFPAVVFYDNAYPVGNVFWWPVPAASIYELFILVKTPIAGFTSLSQVLNLPDEYQAAINYNLQVRTRAAYRLPADPVIVGLAKDALQVIRSANAQVATLQMPRSVVQNQRAYNVFSDGP